MIKIISIGLTFFLIKFITFLFVLLFILINKESEDILNCNKNDSEDRIGNYSIKPINYYFVPDDLPIGTLLYNKYWNEVFNLTYLKIKIGRKNFWFKVLKKIDFKSILKIFFYFFTGINKIFIRITKIILNYEKEEKIEDFLFKKLINVRDDRLIIKVKGEWNVNGRIDILLNKIKQKMINENKLSHEHIEYTMTWIEKIIVKHDSKINQSIKDLIIQKGTFTNKITKIKHWHTLDIIKDENKIPYITDEDKAIQKEYYGLKPILKGINLEKKSVLLELDKDKTILSGNKIKLEAHQFIKSAYYNGYNKEIMKDKFLDQIFIYEKIRLELSEDLKMIIYDELMAKELEKTISDELLDSFFNGIVI